MTSIPDPKPAGNAAILGLGVGTRMQVRALDEVGATEHFSSLIGYVKDEFLLVKLPVVRGSPVVFYDGTKLQVRAFTGTTIHTFGSTVTRTLLNPFRYMHLSYPAEIASATLRTALRVRVRIPVQIDYTPPGKSAATSQGVLANLSISGASMECHEAMTVGQSLQCGFRIEMDGVEHAINTAAIVRSVNIRSVATGQSEDVFACGIQFEEISPADETIIRLLSYERLLTDRQNIV